MGKNTPDKQQTSDQAGRFLETARQLECDEDKDRFEEKLGKIARHRPAAEPRPKRPKER